MGNDGFVRAAKIANSRIHAVFAKDRPEAEGRRAPWGRMGGAIRNQLTKMKSLPTPGKILNFEATHI